MMAAAADRGALRAAVLLSPPCGVAGSAGAGASGAGVLSPGTVVVGPGPAPLTVPMNLFATWEIDRSSPSCVPSRNGLFTVADGRRSVRVFNPAVSSRASNQEVPQWPGNRFGLIPVH
ncbi:hypothetical protein AOLI_G00014220 [Acnodon oligacanthus]